MLEGRDFGWALSKLKEGLSVRRMGWNGNGMSLSIQWPEDISDMTLPYIYISTVQGDLVPWLASQTDLLSNDWEIAA
jgi:hypothetical protein